MNQRLARAFLGTAMGMGFLASATLEGCGKAPLVDHTTSHDLFEGSVKITRTETTQRSMMEDNTCAVRLDFEFNQPGNYLFEGWTENYRSRDTLGEKWECQVTEVPYIIRRNLHSRVYRLEGTRIGNMGQIERDTEEFVHIARVFHAGQSISR